MRKLIDYSNDMQTYAHSPEGLANLLVEMSAHYAYLTEKHILMNLEKAQFEYEAKEHFVENGEKKKREKPLSDKAVENRWRITEKGKKEYETKRTVKALENLKRDLNTILFQKTQEMKQEKQN